MAHGSDDRASALRADRPDGVLVLDLPGATVKKLIKAATHWQRGDLKTVRGPAEKARWTIGKCDQNEISKLQQVTFLGYSGIFL